MRLLHTSDWHLGRTFHRVDLLPAQAAYIDHLVEVVRSEAVDVLLVSGDVYDRALPGTDAVDLLDSALTRLREHARVIVTSGNHDSARRLGFGHRLIDAAGVYVRTDPQQVGVPVLLADEAGTVACYPLPYLDPEAVAGGLAAEEPTHRGVLRAALSRVRQDLARRPGHRSVVLAHVFASGAEASESERDISVGGLSDVPVSTFEGFDYVALGHLHGPQALRAGIRYSGSPIAYSFGEAQQQKSSWLVELTATGLGAVSRIEAPVPRRLARIEGELDDLVHSSRWARYEDHYVAVTLTDPVRPRDAMDRLRLRFPHTLQLTFEPAGGVTRDATSYVQRVRGRSDLEIAAGFVHHVRDRAAEEWERALLREAVERAVREESA